VVPDARLKILSRLSFMTDLYALSWDKNCSFTMGAVRR